MKDSQGYSKILQGLFPGHPARHLLCTGVQCNEDGSKKKSVVTIKHGALLQDYDKHLDPESYGGTGALGIIPTFPKSFEEKNRWLVQFLALDFDQSRLTDMMPLVAMLEEYRVYVYLDTGTTGRGVHPYIFLSEALHQREAHAALVTIANLSKYLELPYPEFMPSSTTGSSKGIFLPYRGAAEDGFGANPLIDPIGGEQIPLDAAETKIYRTAVEDLRDFVEHYGSIEGQGTSNYSNPSYNPIEINTYAGAIEAWEAEIRRLEEHWVDGKRQNLTLGATAYGIFLGLNVNRIKQDIEVLETASSAPEVKKRLKGVDNTLEKYVKGERIAFRPFYKWADVEPPRSNRVVPWEVILRLQILEQQLLNIPFKGMGGFTDLDVLSSLIEVGRKYGKLHSEGVEISISVRNLAEIARTGADTISNSLKRLRLAGWVKMGNRSVGTKSSSWVLLIDEEVLSEQLLTDNEEQTTDEVIVPIPRFRWGAGKLGKMSRPVLETIQRLQPCTRADVARAMGRESSSLRNPMNRLWEYGLVNYDEDTNAYSLPAEFQDRLFEVLLADGTLETDFKHQKRFKIEREAFKLRLAIRTGERMKYS